MTARQIKTLGQLRQWHLAENYALQAKAERWLKKDKFQAGILRRTASLHKRFADAVEKCLPKPF